MVYRRQCGKHSRMYSVFHTPMRDGIFHDPGVECGVPTPCAQVFSRRSFRGYFAKCLDDLVCSHTGLLLKLPTHLLSILPSDFVNRVRSQFAAE